TTEVPAHKVIYEWSGDIPAGETLPTDGNSYVKNQNYTVDTAYTDQTTVQSFDAFGNVNGIYSFSGWTDPNNGVMGDEDITIRGVWVYEAQDPTLFPDPETPPEEITPDQDPLPEEEQPLPEDGQAPEEEQPSEEDPLPDKEPIFEEEQTPEPKPEEPANPYTGDVPIELFFLLWISSAAALILLIPLRRKTK
ncbi:MAG: hypothetical protein IJ294_00720, partial [Clostridia bacterium]|nr:hypothetical protein [Clostridia bacterium]